MDVAKDDVVRALKRCKRLAKQDLLASHCMSDPEFWRSQAESRRLTYTVLTERIQHYGLDAAYQYALSEYAALPAIRPGDHIKADQAGTRQAFEMFFTIMGVGKNNLKPSLNPSERVTASGAVGARA